MRRIVSVILILNLIWGLCACGSNTAGDMANTETTGEQNLSSAEPAGGEAAPDNRDISSEPSLRQQEAELAVEPDEDEVILLDISFYETKEEALLAAGDSCKEIVDVAETESENPMSWYYMIYTAKRDAVEVEYQKGYDTLTIGDSVGGFYPQTMESWSTLNEGESVVAHVNVEWYPVFQLVATDSIYKGKLPLGWYVYTSGQDNEGIPAPVTLTGLIINTPISLYKCDEHLTDGFSSPNLEYGYYSHVDYFLTDSEHPALQKRLKTIASERLETYKKGLGTFGEDAKGAYDRDKPDTYKLYYNDLYTSLCRADNCVLSWVDHYITYLGSVWSRTAVGHNLDTRTGEDIALSDVITDPDELIRAVSERCSRMDYPDKATEAYTDNIRKALKAGGLTVSSDELSWNICYEGLWLHFNDPAATDLTYATGGRNSVFLSFTEYPDLVRKKYKNVPEAYCYAIEHDETFNEYYDLDIDRDGEYEELALRDQADPMNDIYTVEIQVDGIRNTFSDGIDSSDYDALVVHVASGQNYLYICQGDDAQYGEIAIYDLTEELDFVDVVYGNVIDMYMGGAQEADRSGIYMTDPGHFIMSRRDDRLGANVSYATHGTARDGTPYNSDDYYYYAFDDHWTASPYTDMKLDKVNEDGDVTGSGILKAGTYVRALRTNDWDVLDIIDRSGNIWRLDIEMSETNGYGITIDGESPEGLFSGIGLLWEGYDE